MIHGEKTALLLVISAPSGAGKTTLCQRLMADFPDMAYSVSCTTRPPRASEVSGKSYHFLPEAEFLSRVEGGEFLEHAEVYGHHYGTLKATVLEGLRAGRDVLMDLDLQGARSLREYVRGAAPGDPLRRGHVDIFIGPPSIEVLERRLRDRGEDDAATIQRRLNEARDEIAHWQEYQYAVVNDRLDESYDALRSIVIAEHHRNR